MSIKTYAVLEGEEVVNLILLDDESDYAAPEGTTLVPITDDAVTIGWKMVSDAWVAPPEPEPEVFPTEDPSVTEAKMTALGQLVGLGISDDVARTIVGLPPA
jgi:hypothetical protein